MDHLTHGEDEIGGMPLELTRQMKSMWGRVFVLLLGVVILTVVTSHAAGFATPGVGIKARSMGGAFRGLADDWSAVSSNPAGLAFLKSSELNVTLGTYSTGFSYTPNVTANGYDMGFKDGKERFPLNDIFPLPSFAGIAVPSQTPGWVFGGAIFWPHDVNYSWDLFRSPSNYNNDYIFARKNFRSDLDVIDFHPAVAHKLRDNLSVGGGLSLTSADLVYRRVLFVDNPLGSGYNHYPYDRFLADFQVNGKGFAVGGNAGVFWHLSDNLSVGFSGQTPVTVRLKGKAQLDMAWPVNYALSHGRVVLGGDTLTSDKFFSGNYREGYSAKSRDLSTFEMDLKLPAQIGVGVGWTASSRLTLAFDAGVTFWSVVDSWKIELAGDGLNTSVGYLPVVVVPFGWKNQIRISGGAEYAARENLMLRGGLYYDGLTAPDSTFGPAFPDIGSKLGVTFGGAYTISGHLELAAAQELGFYSKRNITGIGTGVGETVYPGEYKSLRTETLFSMTYRF